MLGILHDSAAAVLVHACHGACYSNWSGIVSDRLSELIVNARSDLSVWTYQSHLTLADLCCQ